MKYKAGDRVIVNSADNRIGIIEMVNYLGHYYIKFISNEDTIWAKDKDVILDIKYYRNKQINSIING